jgi:hypothetical protein
VDGTRRLHPGAPVATPDTYLICDLRGKVRPARLDSDHTVYINVHEP